MNSPSITSQSTPSKITKRKNSNEELLKKVKILSEKDDEEILKTIIRMIQNNNPVLWKYFSSSHMDRFYNYLMDNPTVSTVEEFMNDQEIFNDDQDLILGLFAHAVNSCRVEDLARLISSRTNLIEDSKCYNFVIQYPDYQIWKTLSKALGVKVTCIFGAYYYVDQIPFQFYKELIEDVGTDKVLRAITEDPHENECYYIKGYVNEILNENDFREAQKKTGMKCPKVSLREVNMNNHHKLD